MQEAIPYNYDGADNVKTSNLSFAESQPDSYQGQYAALASWVDASLEDLRPELTQLLYPLFVYCYLNSVKEQQGMRAKDMMRRVKHRFLQEESASMSVTKELEDLSTVQHPQDLQNSVPKALMNSMTRIPISRPSHALLKNFIQRREMWSILAICNEHLRFDIQLQPIPVADLPPVEGLLVKDTGNEGLQINSQPVEVGLLQGCVEDVLVVQVLDAGQDSATPAAAAAAPQADAGPDALDMDRAKEPADGEDEAGPSQENAENAPAVQDGANGAAPAADGGTAAAKPAAKARGNKKKAEELERQKEQKENNTTVLNQWKAGLVKARIPLKPLPDDVQAAELDQLRNCAPLSPPEQVCCCMLAIPQSRHTVNCMAATDDVTLAAAGTADSCVQLYNLTSQPRAGAMQLDGDAIEANLQCEDPPVRRLWAHSGPVYGLSFSSDKRILYSSGGDGTVRSWVVSMGANLMVWHGHMLPVWDVQACPRGHWFASAGADWCIRLWCDEHKHYMRAFSGHQGEVDTIAWHPNCNLLVSGSGGDRSVRLWDINSGECVRVMPKHAHGVSKVAVSPDGTTVAAGTLDGVVQLWDIRKAEALTTLRQHRSMILSLAFSRGSQLLASGGADCMLSLWQPTGQGDTAMFRRRCHSVLSLKDRGRHLGAVPGFHLLLNGNANFSNGTDADCICTHTWGTLGTSRVDDSKAYASVIFEKYPGVGSVGPVPYKLQSWHLTADTPLPLLQFTKSNLLLAGGPREARS